MGFWPEKPSFCHDVEATFSVLPFELFRISTPEQSARRQPAWTGIFVEPTAKLWMVSASTPVDMDGRHVATISHDILLEELMDRTLHNTQDKRGQNVLPFLSRLGKYMQEEGQELQVLMGDVSRHTEHIGAIVKLQQRYARTPQLFEPVNLQELVEDALRINLAALGRHAVKVERSLEPLPPVLTEKHKVLMILVNLISNAKYALETVPQDERRMTLTLARSSAGHIRIEVQDNGIGIAPEMQTRIFQYGFTTREEGHGFGGSEK